MSLSPLPVLSCDDCGACCHGMGGTPVVWYLGIYPFGDKTALPPDLLAEMQAMLTGWLAHGFLPDSAPCVWYDAETKRCKHYEFRPNVCVEFEVGGEDCLRIRAMRLDAPPA